MWRKRTVVVAAGLAALAVAGVFLSQWKAIVERYHLERLRRDPEALESYVRGPVDGLKRKAQIHEAERGR